MMVRRIPSLNWLRVFETAARTESFAHAAKLLNMSAPAVSQQIKALEGYLGKPLFLRGARHVKLTAEGRAFLPVVQQSLSSVETTAAALFGPRDSELLSIQVLFLIACSWLPERLTRFEEQHPHIHLQITNSNTPEDFRRQNVDLHISFGSATDFPEDAERLFGETIFPVARPDIAAKIHTPQDLLKHRLIEVVTHRSGWIQVLYENSEADLSEATYCFADNTVVAMAMTAEGYGITLARSPGSDALVKRYGLVPCLDDLKIKGQQHHYVYSPLAQPAKSASLLFRKWLRKEAQNN